MNLMRSPSREPATRRPVSGPVSGERAVITGIVPAGRREDRYDIVVGGKRFAVLASEGVQRLGLHTGDDWSELLAARVAEEAEALRVYDRALAMLVSRGRAARELRLILLKKREPEPLVNAAIDRLTRVGALNDELFARQFVRERLARGSMAPRRVQSELARRGVSRATIEAALAEVREEESIDDAAAIEKLAARKLRTMAKLEPPVRRRRLFAFLSRRGYDADDIRAAMEKLAH